MKGLIFSATPFYFPFYIFLFLITRLSSLDGVATNLYASCSNVFSCGTITGVDYPFYGGDRPAECGHPGLELDCDDDIITTIEIMNVKYRVLAINQDTQVVTITREDLSEDICLEEFVNTTLDSRLFEYASEYKNLTFLYGCPPSGPATAGQFNCPVNGISYSDGYVQIGAQGPGLTCHASVVVPIKNTSFEGIGSLGDVLAQGFEVGCKVDNTACTQCKNSSGQCGYDQNLNKFKCLCANQSSASETCLSLETDPRPPQSPELSERPKKPERPGTTEGRSQKPLPDTAQSESESESKSATSKNEKPLRVGLGVAGAIVAGIGIGFSIFFYKQRRKKVAAQAALALQTESKDLKTIPSNKPLISPPPNAFTKSIPPYPSPKSDLGRGSTYFGVQVFSYSDLELATDNFHPSRELGDGGFGAVYHGTLPDGRVVAVKRLYENNFKRVEQFMNEVEILARLRHKNLVQLYGCTSKKSQGLLLVYEFIPNGTVADHLHGKRANSGLLSWSIRMNIAVETAEALAYLHASDIIHRDVKTTNILLDNGFHVKVADFGLSRLFPTNVTHVSTAPQGTPGYVDPEYYQCYQLTEKSDVYSFGVVLIELISSLQAVDTNRHRQDINLANMAVNKIQNHALNDLVDRSLGFETNSSVRRMATQVAGLAFRCLQQERDARPSMQEVLEALRGVQNEELNAQKAEVVEIVVDDVALLKGHIDTPSPDSVGTSKGVNSSTSDSI